MGDEIRREKQIKKRDRPCKLELIEKIDPGWRDLHDEIDSTATLVELTTTS
jgi:putative endonuclease